eukprot:scaffold45607_cov237-Amphora_coffeaeformis.AAC.12
MSECRPRQQCSVCELTASHGIEGIEKYNTPTQQQRVSTTTILLLLHCNTISFPLFTIETPPRGRWI